MEVVAAIFLFLIIIGCFTVLPIFIISYIEKRNKKPEPLSEREKYEKAKDDFNTLKKENSAYAEKINQIHQKIASLKKEKNKLENEIATLTANKKQNWPERSSELPESPYENQQTIIERLQQQIQNLNKQLAEAQEQLAKSYQTCDNYELQKVRRTNRELKDKIRDLTSELEEAEKENEALQDEIDELKDRLEEDSDDDKYSKEDYRNALVHFGKENEALKAQLAMKTTVDSSHETTLEELREVRAELADAQEQLAKYTANGDFRKRYPAHYRTHDGHWVRSKIEREIANFLYDHKIRYEFEREYVVPNTKITYYPDFYLPDHHLFIEYFGKEDPEYVEKRETKKQHYARDSRYRFEYVSFDDDYLLEEHLKEILRRHGIIY